MAGVPFDRMTGKIWFNGAFVDWGQAQIHVLTHGLHYGSCVFEGQRIYNGTIYKLKEHTARLFFSAETLGMKIPFTQDQINQACIDVAAAQGITDAFIDAELLAEAIGASLSGNGTFEELMEAHEAARNERVRPMYEFTSQLATLEPLPPEMQALIDT